MLKGRDTGYTETLDALVVALCRDYPRRETALERGSCTHRTGMEYRYINYQMADAAAEISGERLAPIYIEEIGNKIGYAHSQVDCVSETTYKEDKQSIKINIARKLHLLD